MPNILVLVIALMGCNGDGGVDPTDDPTDGRTVSGEVTDRDGAQGRFAGSGTLAATTMVESYTIADDGTLTAVATAEVQADGSYSVTIPDEADFYVVAALDANSNRLGSVVVEPSDDDLVLASPIDSETSVEASVFLSAEANPMIWGHIRARVDNNTAVAVRTAADGDAKVEQLSTSVRASAQTQAQAWSDAGLNATAIQEAQLEASARLSADLHAGTANAYGVYFDALTRAEGDAGATAEQRAHAHADASLAFRTTLQAQGATDLLNASASATAQAEADAWDEASIALLSAAGASQTVLDAAADLNAEFKADLQASTSASVVAAAAANWRAELIGSASVDGSLLGDAVGTDLIVEAALDTAVDAALAASAAVEASIQASTTAAVAAPQFDAEAFATLVVDAMEVHRSTLRSTLETSLVAVPSAAAAATLIVEADAAFKGY